MNLPDEKREALAGVVAQEVIEHAAHMETYTLPALQQGFMEGWNHALRLLTRDVGFIGSKSADALAPVVARWLAEARGEALREAADDLMRESREIREAFRQHNAGRDLSVQAARRPDLRAWADANEAAAHHLNARAAQNDRETP